ncbi:MAG: pilin [Candidatus Paceibacterota bacterium]
MKKISTILAGLSFMFPMVSLAATGGTDLTSLILKVSDWIQLLTPIVIALALLYFFYGLARYILNAGNEEKKAEGKNIMIYGIIALFVMVSVWGLVSILVTTLGITTGGTENLPFVTTP